MQSMNNSTTTSYYDFSLQEYTKCISFIIKKQKLKTTYSRREVDLFFDTIMNSKKINFVFSNKNVNLESITIYAIKTLISKEIGRVIFSKILSSNSKLEIRAGNFFFQGKSSQFPDDHIHENNEKLFSGSTKDNLIRVTDNTFWAHVINPTLKINEQQIRLTATPFFISLANNLIRYVYKIEKFKSREIKELLIDEEFDDLEDQIAITGLRELKDERLYQISHLCENVVRMAFNIKDLRIDGAGFYNITKDISLSELALKGESEILKRELQKNPQAISATHIINLSSPAHSYLKTKSLSLLAAAIYRNDSELFSYLHNRGARISKVDLNLSPNPFTLAFINAFPPYSSSSHAMQAKKILEILIKANTKAQNFNLEKLPMLFYAFMYLSFESFSTLLLYVNINNFPVDIEGNTLLMHAIRCKMPLEKIALLLKSYKHKMNLLATNYKGKDALYFANEHNSEVLKCLVLEYMQQQ